MKEKDFTLESQLQTLGIREDDLTELTTREEQIGYVKHTANARLHTLHPDVCDKNIPPEMAKKNTQELISAREYIIEAIKAGKILTEKEVNEQIDEAIDMLEEKRQRRKQEAQQAAARAAQARRAEQERAQQAVAAEQARRIAQMQQNRKKSVRVGGITKAVKQCSNTAKRVMHAMWEEYEACKNEQRSQSNNTTHSHNNRNNERER